MIFKIFRGNSHYRNGYFQEIRENHVQGEFVKIWEYTLVIFFSLKNDNLGSKITVLNFLGIHPKHPTVPRTGPYWGSQSGAPGRRENLDRTVYLSITVLCLGVLTIIFDVLLFILNYISEKPLSFSHPLRKSSIIARSHDLRHVT